MLIYTIQPVVKPVVVKPVDNRLYRVYKHSTSCQTRLTTRLTTGVSCIQPVIKSVVKPVVKPVVQPVWQPVVSCKRGITVCRSPWRCRQYTVDSDSGVNHVVALSVKLQQLWPAPDDSCRPLSSPGRAIDPFYASVCLSVRTKTLEGNDL